MADRPQFLILVQAIAAFREREAQRRDVPRNRVLRDDVLLDIAARAPATPEELAKVRSISANFATSNPGAQILKAISQAKQIPIDLLVSALLGKLPLIFERRGYLLQSWRKYFSPSLILRVLQGLVRQYLIIHRRVRHDF